MPYEQLTKQRLTQALRRLSELATAGGLMLDFALYGGAVFTLVYGSRETTKDVDGVIRPSAAGTRLISQVAGEQNLPANWLNDDVRQFLSHQSEHRPFPSKDFEPGLKITIPPPPTCWLSSSTPAGSHCPDTREMKPISVFFSAR